uniref:Uncharacterized protein n=1 Tax=Accipiter nisus TaxID=211598 RepID=A0A8B9NH98_9AVES
MGRPGGGKEGSRRGPEPCRGGPRGPKEPLVLQFGAAAPPAGLVDSGTQTDISFESRLGPGRGRPPGPPGDCHRVLLPYIGPPTTPPGPP